MLANLHHMYLDTNNLYGHFIMQILPTEILDWINSKEFNLHNNFNDSPTESYLRN